MRRRTMLSRRSSVLISNHYTLGEVPAEAGNHTLLVTYGGAV